MESSWHLLCSPRRRRRKKKKHTVNIAGSTLQRLCGNLPQDNYSRGGGGRGGSPKTAGGNSSFLPTHFKKKTCKNKNPFFAFFPPIQFNYYYKNAMDRHAGATSSSPCPLLALFLEETHPEGSRGVFFFPSFVCDNQLLLTDKIKQPVCSKRTKCSQRSVRPPTWSPLVEGLDENKGIRTQVSWGGGAANPSKASSQK